MSEYGIPEGSSVSVCAVQQEASEKPYSVNIQAPTSQGNQNAFPSLPNQQLIFL